MMNRYEEMDSFLKYYGKLYKQNPDAPIADDTLYHALCIYDYSDFEIKNRNLDGFFDSWINRYKNVPNIDVFHSPLQKRFLQFHNKKGEIGKEYKLYLSFPKDKLYDCVNKIFDYIAKNNMPTFSKVADYVRSDSVVLRMRNKEDVDKLVNFINNDAELVNAARKTNPFLMKNGIVGYAYDDRLSYNDVLCNLMADYFENCRDNDTFDNVSLENFYKFVNQYYYDVFVSCDKLEEFDEKYRFRGSYGAVNIKQVFEIIGMSLRNNTNFDDYHSFIEDCRNNKKNKSLSKKYFNVMNPNYNKHGSDDIKTFVMHNNDDTDDNNNLAESERILNNFIVLAASKYGIKEVAPRIGKYLEGKPNFITREGNFRYLFKNVLTPNDILSITNGKIEDYILNVVRNNKNEDVVNLENYQVFCDACKATLEKYDYNQLYCAVTNGSRGEFKFFSNGDNKGYRRFFRENIKEKEIESFCIKYLTDNNYELDDNQDLYTVFCELIDENQNALSNNDDRGINR